MRACVRVCVCLCVPECVCVRACVCLGGGGGYATSCLVATLSDKSLQTHQTVFNFSSDLHVVLYLQPTSTSSVLYLCLYTANFLFLSLGRMKFVYHRCIDPVTPSTIHSFIGSFL